LSGLYSPVNTFRTCKNSESVILEKQYGHKTVCTPLFAQQDGIFPVNLHRRTGIPAYRPEAIAQQQGATAEMQFFIIGDPPVAGKDGNVEPDKKIDSRHSLRKGLPD